MHLLKPEYVLPANVFTVLSSQCNENFLHLLPKMRKAGDEIIMSLQRNF